MHQGAKKPLKTPGCKVSVGVIGDFLGGYPMKK